MSVYRWLAHSDLTSAMLGPPHYPNNPIPTEDEFKSDYTEEYYSGSNVRKGQSFIIEIEGTPVGHINHNEVIGHEVELDIWLASSQYTGKCYGVEAINLLCAYVHSAFGCTRILIAPSQRNTMAIRAYSKAGFSPTVKAPHWFVPDYPGETVLMERKMP